MGKNKYEEAGVKHLTKSAPPVSIISELRKTFDYRKGKIGEVLLDFGPYANVIKINESTGIALKTDGVGTKILVAQMMNKFDTIGIDCIAMNVNDLICIGAEPLAMLDYIAVELADTKVFLEISKGLKEGARIANITIPGGEVAQIKDMLKGVRPNSGMDLVGSAVGIVDPTKIISGRDARPGDLLIGFKSSGLHSNGYTLARKVLLGDTGFDLNQKIPQLGKKLWEELLTPTKIYVPEFMAMKKSGLDLKALFHFTGGGLLNLQRIEAPVGFEINNWPETMPIFSLIKEKGNLSDEDMFSIFNMGVGFGVVVSPEDKDKVISIAKNLKSEALVIGKCTQDLEKKIVFEAKSLIGKNEQFIKR